MTNFEKIKQMSVEESLKSNMDRFIVSIHKNMSVVTDTLKSNMDRFIAFNNKLLKF